MHASLQLLKRQAPDLSMEALDRRVIEEAFERLHYRPATVQMQNEKKAKELAKALKDLDIVPFDPNSVKLYQSRVRFGNMWLQLGIRATIAGSSIFGAITISPWFIAGFVMVIVSLVAIPIMGGRWRQETLEQTSQVIPIFALDTALAIKKKLPYAAIRVEYYLTAKELYAEREGIASDPFLLVQYGDEEVYVEVWDEPKFNATRKA